MLLTPGFAQCLPCIRAAKISQNSYSLLPKPSPGILQVAELSHGAPADLLPEHQRSLRSVLPVIQQRVLGATS